MAVWTRSTRDAMERFTELANAKLPTQEPDIVLLSLVRGYAGNTGCDRSVITAWAPNIAPSSGAPPLDGHMALAGPQVEAPAPSAAPSVTIPARRNRSSKQGWGIGFRNFGRNRPIERGGPVRQRMTMSPATASVCREPTLRSEFAGLAQRVVTASCRAAGDRKLRANCNIARSRCGQRGYRMYAALAPAWCHRGLVSAWLHDSPWHRQSASLGTNGPVQAGTTRSCPSATAWVDCSTHFWRCC